MTYLRNLEHRKEEVILLIDVQGKLTPELEQQIREATQLQRVEDLYKPYRKKRQTRAQKAREAGLEPLANMIIMQASVKGTALDAAAEYMTPEAAEAGYDTPEKILAGAQDIVAETVAEDAENVADIRAFTEATADITSVAVNTEEKTQYEPYYDYAEPVAKIPNHRILAIDRGEREEKLRVHIRVDAEAAIARLGSRWPRRQGVFAPIFDAAIADGYKRLMAPSLEREVRAKLTVRAQSDAIQVLQNLKDCFLRDRYAAPELLLWIQGIELAARWQCSMKQASCLIMGWFIPPSRVMMWLALNANLRVSYRSTTSTRS